MLKLSFNEKMRHFLHEFYYYLAPNKGVEFAMRCKDVAEKIDLGEVPTVWSSRMRFRLHLILCQACRNYFDATQALKRTVGALIKNSQTPIQLEKLNRDLLRRFAKNLPPRGS